jgi:tetratricopeptide (TPR) repeat protein
MARPPASTLSTSLGPQPAERATVAVSTHPTIFELNAFGRCQLPAAQGRAVLRHLRGGCARCRAALSTHLILWLDDGPAAEARAVDPRRCGRALEAAYLQAAASAFQAATQLRTPPDADPDVEDARAILEAEGPAAIGRLPRRLLGPAAVEALLQLTSTLGARDPFLRLRFAELACDLANHEACAHGAPRALRSRTAIELANAHRVLGRLQLAQEQLDHAREELLRGTRDPLIAARLLVIQGLVTADQWRLAPARQFLSAAARIYRRRGLIDQVAQAGVSGANVLHYAGRFDDALRSRLEILQVLDRERAPETTAAALNGVCNALLELGHWREALDVLRRERAFLVAHSHGCNASRDAQLEGRLLHRAGDIHGAARAFAASRRMFESQGCPYFAAIASLFWAAALEERGDWDGARARIMEGTEPILKLHPEREVNTAVMLLRTTRRFSATRDALPLERMIDFLYRAPSDPDLRLDSLLG